MFINTFVNTQRHGYTWLWLVDFEGKLFILKKKLEVPK